MFSLSACGEEHSLQETPELPTEQPGGNEPGDDGNIAGQTPVTLTVGDKVLDAYLNNTTAADDLLSRLPVTVRLSDSGHDYCGGINPPLTYRDDEVQYGWHDGDLAFWTAGDDFVIFHDDEETSSSTGNLVIIGHVTSDIEEVRSLGSSIEVTILRKTSEETSDNNNQTDNDMNRTQFNVKVKVGDRELTATLLNNVTTRAFVEKLPITLPMMDLYSREMCYRFSEALPTDDVNTCGYEVGEIVYYPPMHSFVIMYAQNGEHFSMQKLGRIDSGVEIFRNTGNTDVIFELVR